VGVRSQVEGEEFVLESLEERPHLAAMNSLSNGFFFIVALSWLLCEVCVSASAGNHLPLAIFAVGLIVMFSILGCIRVSNETLEKAGPIFTLLLGGGILLYGLGSFDASVVGALLRVLGGLVVIGFGVITLLAARDSSKDSAH